MTRNVLHPGGIVCGKFRGERAFVVPRPAARRGEHAGDGHVLARGKDLPQRVVPELADVRGLPGLGVGLADEPLGRAAGLAQHGAVDVAAAHVRAPAGNDVPGPVQATDS